MKGQRVDDRMRGRTAMVVAVGFVRGRAREESEDPIRVGGFDDGNNLHE